MELSTKLKHYRLSTIEYELMTQLLGREPKDIEWPLFSALWSEHCSYKSSKVHLKKFARTLKHQKTSGVGENAGVVDLGEGERIAFKMESHNHPSFIEPFQGAATGVGGILRDVFTMGAKPIALADFLCFGEKDAPRMREIMKGVVKGIGTYGNCVGVPTLTGETQFDPSYNGNVLVNAMAVGYLAPGDKLASAEAKGPGNLILYVGSKTGKDGVHGAAMASESFGQDSESKKPNVQIGDPFYEKLLIDSCLEVIQKNLVVAIQDMGAAGLTSSSFEMAVRGNVGFDLHLDKVPLRDSSLSPEEILLSESQERMLLVAEPKNLKAIQDVFHKYDLDAAVIGQIRSDNQAVLYWKSEVLTSVDPKIFVDQAPLYERSYVSSAKSDFPAEKFQMTEFVNTKSSKAPIYEQYDQRVGTLTVKDASQDVAVVRLPASGRALGMALGARVSVLARDVELGALDAVFYPSLRLALKGIRALAVTDCLNFGNPEKPEIMGQFAESVDSIIRACDILGLSVISGNVSFYNETMGKNVVPTPATGLVGVGSKLTGPLPELKWSSESGPLHVGVLSLRNDLARHRTCIQDVRELQEFLLNLPADLRAQIDMKMVGEWGVAGSLWSWGLNLENSSLDVYTQNRWECAFYSVLVVGSEDALKTYSSRVDSSSTLIWKDLGLARKSSVPGSLAHQAMTTLRSENVFS